MTQVEMERRRERESMALCICGGKGHRRCIQKRKPCNWSRARAFKYYKRGKWPLFEDGRGRRRQSFFRIQTV